MEIWEVVLIGVALSMDAVAVGLTDGMSEPHMGWGKTCSIAAVFAVFQFLMPVLGYYAGYAFSSFVEKVAPYVSFALLALIGVKMIVDCALELYKKRRAARAASSEDTEGDFAPPEPSELSRKGKFGVGKLLLQGIATSIDALAVGVTFFALDTADSLPMSAIWCSVIIGAITFALSFCAVLLGKRAGDRFSDKAEIAGGVILIGVGLKILLEGIL